MHIPLNLLKLGPKIDFHIFGISNPTEELLLRKPTLDSISLSAHNFLFVTIHIYGYTPPPVIWKINLLHFRSPPSNLACSQAPSPPLLKIPFNSQPSMWKGGKCPLWWLITLQVFKKIDAHYAVSTFAFNWNFLTYL